MYDLHIANKKTEEKLSNYITQRKDIIDKLNRLKENPRKANGAHQLHGKLKGEWACWLGSNIRIMYIINEELKRITIEVIGTHKIY